MFSNFNRFHGGTFSRRESSLWETDVLLPYPEKDSEYIESFVFLIIVYVYITIQFLKRLISYLLRLSIG